MFNDATLNSTIKLLEVLTPKNIFPLLLKKDSSLNILPSIVIFQSSVKSSGSKAISSFPAVMINTSSTISA